MSDLKRQIADTTDEAAVRRYLEAVLDKEAFDRKGLIYGMGHAVYSDNDPRAAIFKNYVANSHKRKASALGKNINFTQLLNESLQK